MPAGRKSRVEADAELGDHIGTSSGVRDELAQHLRRPSALDGDDAASFELERDGRVDKALDGVRNGEVGDEDAVGAVFQRRYEDLAAREVVAVAGFERQGVAQPRAALDAQS